jgi:polar amino acid transport system substrate-binding protein
MIVTTNRPYRGRTWIGIVAVLLAAAAGSLASMPQTSSLRFVSTAWAPFTNEAGKPRFALDLVEEALGRVNIKTTTSIVDPAQFTAALLSGPFDGTAAAWRDAEREKALVFSRPYLENRLILVGRRGSDVSAPSLSALAGKRVAIVGGYSYGDLIDAAGPTFVRSQSEEDSLSQLLGSKVEYTLMDELVVQYILTNHPSEAQARLQLGTKPLITRPLYLAVRRSVPDAAAIVDHFNAQVRSLIADGTYHRLLHVDWITADMDGDGTPEYVSRSTQAGTTAPVKAYPLISTGEGASQQRVQVSPHFYIGGAFYNSWTDVPDNYKVSTDRPAISRSTGSVFTFTWK